jgi:transposase
MNDNSTPFDRLFGLDCHPDSITAALVTGQTPAAATVQKIFDAISTAHFQSWAKDKSTPDDLFVLEASGNSFQIARDLKEIGRRALVLESAQLGRLKEAHANNDKISAVRIAKAYLAGTAKTVWIPDALTQERRDWAHAYRKAVKRTTQLRNRLASYLSDNGVRLDRGQEEGKVELEAIAQAKKWTDRQWRVIEVLASELEHAQQSRQNWNSLIAQDVLEDPKLLSLVRLCGVREIVAFALGAIIGDISRFASPKKLVKYVGLNPAFDHSGAKEWNGGIGGHGRRDLRALLIEAAHSILRSKSPLAKWGYKLLARKGELNLVVAAVARKLLVAVWYILMGKWSAVQEIDRLLSAKIGKIITHLGAKGLKATGKNRSQYRKQIIQSLKNSKIYVLDPTKVYSAAPSPSA